MSIQNPSNPPASPGPVTHACERPGCTRPGSHGVHEMNKGVILREHWWCAVDVPPRPWGAVK